MNDKPDSKDAPDGYNYLAQDLDGSWWWHKEKPKTEDWRWQSVFPLFASKNPDWKDALEQRPSRFADLKEWDWVEVANDAGERQAIVTSKLNEYIVLSTINYNGMMYYFGKFFLRNGHKFNDPSVKITRKLNPKEIVINIGIDGIEGRIEKCSHTQESFYLINPNTNTPTFCIINKSMIPESLRKIVDSILEKQEEQKS